MDVPLIVVTAQPDCYMTNLTYPEYSHATAYACAKVSDASYDDEYSPDDARADFNFRRTTWIRARGDAEALVCQSNDAIVVGFRGTEANGRDAVTDLDVRYKKRTYGAVHKGFARYVSRLIDEGLVRQIESLRDRGQQICFTGHSLGGAAAVVAACELQHEHDIKCASVFTFGQPKAFITQPNYRRLFGLPAPSIPCPLYRFVRRQDPVTVIPNTPFGHVGNKYSIGDGGHSLSGYVSELEGRLS